MKKINLTLANLFLVVFIMGCEYERIATDQNCVDKELDLVIESVKDTNCGENTGVINVAVQEGSGEYEFKLNDMDFVSSSSFDALAAGNYVIVAREIETNCETAPQEVTISNANGIQLVLESKNNSNCGENTGAIAVSQQNGTPPIEYSLNNGEFQDLSEFTALASGNYNVVGRDANGCEAEISGIEILTSISFSSDIKPIISTNCAVNGCHNGTQSPNFTVDVNIIQNASKIRSRTGSGTMPPAGRPDLTENEIQAIACWVEDGALNN